LEGLKAMGYSNEQINTIAKGIYVQSVQPSFMETFGGLASAGLQTLATPVGPFPSF